MKLRVCQKCGKAKKKKIPEGAVRLNGQQVITALESWLKDHPELRDKVEVQPVKCFGKCSKGPNILVKSDKKMKSRLTEEKLQKLIHQITEKVSD